MRASTERITRLLMSGTMELLGLLPHASNGAYAARLTGDGTSILAVYKPRDGEMPLWDFPDGTLYAREVAAYEVSRAMGWDLVPPTIVRDGPFGVGMVQSLIDAEPDQHSFTLLPAHQQTFRWVAIFDVIVNNADRKAGHCLLERATGRVWSVDHGVCFHAQPKLRTVIWDFAGTPLRAPEAAAIQTLLEQLRAGCPLGVRLGELLAGEEVRALRRRAEQLLADGRLPEVPLDRRAYPWPPI